MADGYRLSSQRARKDRARDFLQWREANGGAVLWDPGGARLKARKRARMLAKAESDLVPVDERIMGERG